MSFSLNFLPVLCAAVLVCIISCQSPKMPNSKHAYLAEFDSLTLTILAHCDGLRKNDLKQLVSQYRRFEGKYYRHYKAELSSTEKLQVVGFRLRAVSCLLFKKAMLRTNDFMSDLLRQLGAKHPQPLQQLKLHSTYSPFKISNYETVHDQSG